VSVLYYEYCKFGRDKIERECTSALFSVTLHLSHTDKVFSTNEIENDLK